MATSVESFEESFGDLRYWDHANYSPRSLRQRMFATNFIYRMKEYIFVWSDRLLKTSVNESLYK